MPRQTPKNPQLLGFTLTELMVVIVIISILTTLAYTRFKRVTLHAKVREAAGMLKHIYELEYIYYMHHGIPATTDMLGYIYYGIDWTPPYIFHADREKLLRARLALDSPAGINKFYYVFRSGHIYIHAIPKWPPTHPLFSEKECDAQLAGEHISLSIDNDGSIYIYGLPGVKHRSQL